jgi:transposase-like protein
MSRIYSKWEDKQIIKEYQAGDKVAVIAKRHGATPEIIYEILHEYDVMGTSTKTGRLRKIKDKLAELYTTECFSIRELAVEFDTDPATMYNVLKEAKVTFRSNGVRYLTSRKLELDICRDYLDCRSAKKVGKKYELSHVVILQIARAYGIITSDRYKLKACRRVH